ncbi:MAG: hypothetical protein ONB12_00015 [candidate division KSB1 bacterium]|nr:hypothetical protein [candidate division KSB1 bacterium]
MTYLQIINLLTSIQVSIFLIVSTLVLLFGDEKSTYVKDLLIDFRPLIFWLIFIVGILLLNQSRYLFFMFKEESAAITKSYESLEKSVTSEVVDQAIVPTKTHFLRITSIRQAYFTANFLTLSLLNSICLIAALVFSHIHLAVCFALGAAFFVLQFLFCKIKF